MLKIEPLPSDDPERYSMAKVELLGKNISRTYSGGDSFYKVIEGSVLFAVNGTVHPLREGDYVYVPKGARCVDMSIGGVVMDLCTVPPFDPEQIEYHS